MTPTTSGLPGTIQFNPSTVVPVSPTVQSTSTSQTAPQLNQTSAPSNASGVLNQTSPVIPQSSAPTGNITNATAANAGADSLVKANLASAQKGEDQANQLRQAQTQNQGFLQSVLNQGGANQSAQTEWENLGIDPAQNLAQQQSIIAQNNSLQQQYNALTAQAQTEKNSAIGNADYSQTDTNTVSAAIDREYSPRLTEMAANISANSAALSAMQGNLTQAESLVKDYVANATATQSQQLQIYQDFYTENQSQISQLDSTYQSALKDQIDQMNTDLQQATTEANNKANLLVTAAKDGVNLATMMGNNTSYLQMAQAYNTQVGTALAGFTSTLQASIDAGKTPQQAVSDLTSNQKANGGATFSTANINQLLKTAQGLTANPSNSSGGFFSNLWNGIKSSFNIGGWSPFTSSNSNSQTTQSTGVKAGTLIQLNGKTYSYNGTGDTTDINNWTPQ